ncbi:MAG: CHASE2 domain-containing protein, partial [Patescibacteria group bacterium]
MRKIWARFAPVILASGVAAVAIGASSAGLFVGFEYFLGDQLINPIGTTDEIVIIAIDDESIGKIGQWPWPRA